ncbi:MAG: hypothetical protein Q4B81_08635 [Moraxella sp.]|nr:hypothetical protein [Moraxella sp.]
MWVVIVGVITVMMAMAIPVTLYYLWQAIKSKSVGRIMLMVVASLMNILWVIYMLMVIYTATSISV